MCVGGGLHCATNRCLDGPTKTTGRMTGQSSYTGTFFWHMTKGWSPDRPSTENLLKSVVGLGGSRGGEGGGERIGVERGAGHRRSGCRRRTNVAFSCGRSMAALESVQQSGWSREAGHSGAGWAVCLGGRPVSQATVASKACNRTPHLLLTFALVEAEL